FVYENGTVGQGGPTAVLVCGGFHIVVTSGTVFVVGQQVYKAQGLDPREFDLVVVKSPNGFRPYYEAITSTIVAVDVAGSTSANLHSLPYTQCVRPIFPLDDNVTPPFP
ncbi:MAG: MlrC C-terminal domain-containing protein, partial [Pirellulaceae bacterium]